MLVREDIGRMQKYLHEQEVIQNQPNHSPFGVLIISKFKHVSNSGNSFDKIKLGLVAI